MDFPNRRRQSQYHNIALSRLKLKNFHSSKNALSRPILQGFSFFHFFKFHNCKTWYVMKSRGPQHPTLFPSSHHEKRLYTIRVQLKPFPRTWPLLPYPRVSNAKTTHKNPFEKQAKQEGKHSRKYLAIPPKHTQHTYKHINGNTSNICMNKA